MPCICPSGPTLRPQLLLAALAHCFPLCRLPWLKRSRSRDLWKIALLHEAQSLALWHPLSINQIRR
eukprot:2006770-Pleurochrysis_carterae.AAC.1